jgi:hypothetical protein
LLKKTFRSLKSGGTIAIAEWLVNDHRTKPLPLLMFSVQMLVNTETGGTFSFNKFKEWLEDVGFKKCANWKRLDHHRSFGNESVAVPRYESASHPRVEVFSWMR